MAAAPKLQSRTIKHALFTYALPSGGEAIAFRGDTVDLAPDDVARGEKFDAFTDVVGELPTPQGSTLPDYPDDPADVEQDAWVVAGSDDEILKAVNAKPEITSSVIAAEQRRGDAARPALLEALAKLSN